eukprot:7551353-Alexandrium_andersonii.AAC.1
MSCDALSRLTTSIKNALVHATASCANRALAFPFCGHKNPDPRLHVVARRLKAFRCQWHASAHVRAQTLE